MTTGINEYIWEDRDGIGHFVSEMEESYIYNILKCLNGKGKTKLHLSEYQREEWKSIFEQELQNRTYQIF